jgi:hypothetical protein
MSGDVFGRPARNEMSQTGEPMVAQPYGNGDGDLVAQPAAPGIRSTHIGDGDLRSWPGSWGRAVLVATVGGLLGLCGCANNKPGSTGLHPDATMADGSANGCAVDCTSKGQACSFGRCTSSACQLAELTSNTAVGCLFYTLQADNVTADEAAGTTFLVTGQGPDPVNVELQQWTSNDGPPAWTAVATASIAGGGASARLPISAAEVTATGLSPQAALRISSDRPVTVAEIESDDLAVPATSSGGTMILPLQALGTDYRAVAYPQQTSPDVEDTVGSRGGAARVIVVGTHAGTQVTLTPVGSATGAADGGAGADGGASTVVLGDGDVYQIYTGAEGEDLTGMHISSSGGPVAIFSGNISTSYGSQVVGINSADMAHEQMPPTPAWSTSYVAAALAPQQSIGCTSFFGPEGGSLWRVVAAKDGTQVTLSGPAIASPVQLTLAAGEARTFVEVGNFAVEATLPVLVTQGIDCEPSLSLAIAVGGGQLYTDLPFAVPPGFDLLLGIVRHAGVEVDLDEVDLGDAPFEAVNADYEVAAVPLPACAPTDGSGVCTHRLKSKLGVGMSLRGMDVRSSYVLTVPVLVRCDPTTGSCIS